MNLAAATNSRTLSRSLPVPSGRSVLVFESTPAGRDRRYRLCDVLGAEPTGEDDRDADALDDPPAQAPIMGAPESPELTGTRVVAVEEQKVGNPVIGSGNGDARLVDDRDRPHDRSFGEIWP